MTFKERVKAHTPRAVWMSLHRLRRDGSKLISPVLNRVLSKVILLNLKASRRKQIDNYFARHDVRKLQLGAGSNSLAGWLNSEGFASSSFTHSFRIANGYIFLDICKAFPFESESVDYIFHEHVIEHLDYHQGQFMLRECHRILKPGGRMRIATPDLKIFLESYGDKTTDEQRLFLNEYVRFNSEVWSADLKHVRKNHAVFVINHNLRAWGHQFIYDYETLAEALELAGFSNIVRQQPQQSRDKNLSGLEFRKELVGIFDALIVEATKL